MARKLTSILIFVLIFCYAISAYAMVTPVDAYVNLENFPEDCIFDVLIQDNAMDFSTVNEYKIEKMGIDPDSSVLLNYNKNGYIAGYVRDGIDIGDMNIGERWGDGFQIVFNRGKEPIKFALIIETKDGELITSNFCSYESIKNFSKYTYDFDTNTLTHNYDREKEIINASDGIIISAAVFLVLILGGILTLLIKWKISSRKRRIGLTIVICVFSTGILYLVVATIVTVVTSY